MFLVRQSLEMPAARPTTRPRVRRTQAERTAETRSKLIEATLECLIERGYAGTTTLAVCKRAGVSHGSLLHHFGKREVLLGAALECVYDRLRARVVAGLESLPHGDARVEAMVELMWDAFGARQFKAVLELWLAAANQPDVSWAVWPEARAFDAGNAPLAEQLFPELSEQVPDFHVYVSLLFQTLQGMGLVHATLPADSQGAAMRAEVRALLTRILRRAFIARAGDAQGAVP
jgi:AcrR family transcriptional regulator